MEFTLTAILALLSGLCIVVKVMCLHGQQRQVSSLGAELREYHEAQRELKVALQEENRVRARDQGLARNETRLLKNLGKIRHRLDQVHREQGGDAKVEARKRSTAVER